MTDDELHKVLKTYEPFMGSGHKSGVRNIEITGRGDGKKMGMNDMVSIYQDEKLVLHLSYMQMLIFSRHLYHSLLAAGDHLIQPPE